MALKRIFCSSCGLEILADEPFTFAEYSDVYHDLPMMCFAYRDMGVY